VKQVIDLKETKDREFIKRLIVSRRDKLLRSVIKMNVIMVKTALK